MPNKNIFITGIPDLLTLLILKEEDSYVYDITKKIAERSHGKLAISHNTIYTAAYKLSLGGYISEYSRQVGRKRTRIYYHIEEKGCTYLDEMLGNYLETAEGVNNVLRSLDLLKGETKL